MPLSATYNPTLVEKKWYKHWMKHNFFHAKPDARRLSYCIVMPPPNVTGVLHMGHMLNNSVQDVLVRKARMDGKVACWVPGIDHASIATEARVVAMLREKGIQKKDLSREEFMRYAWMWKEKYGGKILEQLQKMGASCDWDRTTFTLDPAYHKAVIRAFIDLFNKGYIYRDFRMINWDTSARTALSNEEVIYAEEGEPSVLYTVRYAIKGEVDRWVHVATQRPETIMGDVAIAVHPADKRHKGLIGKQVIVPFINREIPIIRDDYVDTSFGTGCLKITPAHDVHDYEIGVRHNLPIIDILSEDGTLNERCEIPRFVGKDRFWVRKVIVEDLRASGDLVQEDKVIIRVGRSERTHSVVEPRLSLQWFMKMKTMAKPASQAVEQDIIKLYPSKFKNMYLHWMNNIRDWCISRQLWWGQRIPAYFYGEGKDDFVLAESIEEAIQRVSKKLQREVKAKDLRQDPDVLDTWMSSWLWPIAVFGKDEDTSFNFQKGTVQCIKGSDLDYFYPTQVLVTAPEIIFFWVARMVMAGYEYVHKPPFENVYLTGIVKDEKRRKMSKSLGNSPDPLDLIASYGADGVRAGLLLCTMAGNDLLFDEKLCLQGRNFSNKIWNAFRLIKSWHIVSSSSPEANTIASTWFSSCLGRCIEEQEQLFANFRLSEALMSIYRLMWNNFCAEYLEIIKPSFGEPIDKITYDKTIEFFEIILKLLHPFMPFITEELWHRLGHRESRDCIIVASWPDPLPYDNTILDQGTLAFELVTQLRSIRRSKNIPFKQPICLITREENADKIKRFLPIISKVAHVETISFLRGDLPAGIGFMVRTVECVVPLGKEPDLQKEIKAMENELTYTRGFLKSVIKKTENKKFMQQAPKHVVEKEKKKQLDAESTINTLQNKLKSLNKKS